MIDIHSHILPGLDDGAGDWETTLGMAKTAEAEGIRTVVVTPHYIEGAVEPARDTVMATIDECLERLAQAKIHLNLLPGHEVYLTSSLPQLIEAEKVFTINNSGKYLLVEFPMQEIPMYAESVFFNLQCMGITPILAHPERNRKIMEDPNRLYGLLEKGILTQINSNSLTGKFGSHVMETAEKLLQCRMVHSLATDAHSTGVRSPVIAEAARKVEELAGTRYAHQLTVEWPQFIIEGKSFCPPAVQAYQAPEKKQGLWGNFKKCLGL